MNSFENDCMKLFRKHELVPRSVVSFADFDDHNFKSFLKKYRSFVLKSHPDKGKSKDKEEHLKIINSCKTELETRFRDTRVVEGLVIASVSPYMSQQLKNIDQDFNDEWVPRLERKGLLSQPVDSFRMSILIEYFYKQMMYTQRKLALSEFQKESKALLDIYIKGKRSRIWNSYFGSSNSSLVKASDAMLLALFSYVAYWQGQSAAYTFNDIRVCVTSLYSISQRNPSSVVYIFPEMKKLIGKIMAEYPIVLTMLKYTQSLVPSGVAISEIENKGWFLNMVADATYSVADKYLLTPAEKIMINANIQAIDESQQYLADIGLWFIFTCITFVFFWLLCRVVLRSMLKNNVEQEIAETFGKSVDDIKTIVSQSVQDPLPQEVIRLLMSKGVDNPSPTSPHSARSGRRSRPSSGRSTRQTRSPSPRKRSSSPRKRT